MGNPVSPSSGPRNPTLSEQEYSAASSAANGIGAVIRPLGIGSAIGGVANGVSGNRATGDPEIDAALAEQRRGSSSVSASASLSANEVQIEAIKAASYRERALWSVGINPNSEVAKQYDVHHVVKQGDRAAAPAQAALASVGIGIHDLENLLVLRREIHRGVHNGAYTTAVNISVVGARPAGYDGVVGTLNYIKSSIIVKGSYP